MKRLAIAALLTGLVILPGRGSAAGAVGYVGCSVSNNAVSGYHLIGGTRFWPVIGSYGGGSLQDWAAGIGHRNDRRWADFQSYLATEPPSQIWVQWCSRIGENHATDHRAAADVILEIKRLAPGVPIYVSAQNDYVWPHICAITGPDGPPRMRALSNIETVVRQAKLGPNVGSLRSRYGIPSIPAGDETTPDGCHANRAGETRVLGPALKKFFG